MPTRKVGQEAAPLVTSYLAAKALGGHRLVVIEPDGRVDYGSCLDLTHPGRLLGLTLNAVVKGDRVSVQRAGAVTEPSWSWRTSFPLWLGKDGQLTQVSPKRGFLCVVGVAIAPQSVLMANIQTAHITYLLDG